MVKNQLKKVMSLAMALAVVLSLSCCGVGDETLIDEIDTETTETTTETTAGETTEEATEIITEELTTTETTTEETTKTTTYETEEATTEETTLTTPEETAILETLTDEEKEVWLSMPDIVTMRMLKRRDEDDNFLYTEIIYIDKMGQIKKFISLDKPKQNGTEHVIEWLNEQINQDESAELVKVADTHNLINFYNSFMLIDGESELSLRYTRTLNEYIERHYLFELYGVRNKGDSNSETLLISKGDAGFYSIRHNPGGIETFDLYLKIDPFMVDIPGGIGHLTDEKG